MNDAERAQWVANDEGLYRWHRQSGLPLRRFIRENRAEIDEVIRQVRDGTKPAHFLVYGNH